MDQSQRVSLRVFVGIEIACFVLLIAGVLTACSPLWTPGGLFGWWNGYQREADVLGIVWLSGSLLSFLLGIVLCIVSAAMGIWIGIAAGIVGLARNRSRREQAKLKDVASQPSSPEG